MPNNEYTLSYPSRDNVAFPSKGGMQRYLANESKNWKAFLDNVHENLGVTMVFNNGQYSVNPEQLSITIETQIGRLDDRNSFNRATTRFDGSIILPPPADSLEGQLILGLFDAGFIDNALGAYVYEIAKGRTIQYRNNDATHRLLEIGRPLVETAPIVVALPYSKVSSAKMAGAVRAAENHAQSLVDEIKTAQTSNDAHAVELESQLDAQKKQAARVNDVILRLNRKRDRRHKQWMEATDMVVEEAFEEARKKVRIFELKSQKAEEARVSEFDRLQSLFETQLRLRAPVKLWDTREIKHSANSNSAMTKFLCAGGVAVAFGLLVPFMFGDYIAGSFSQLICSTPATEDSIAEGCERAFSAKGPVTITGLLLVMSLLMWLARLQYRIHLSERHLALDASEKKAFAETYLAMKQGEDVGKDNEAIVLASLFRPTQDGIIRDDESGMDLSAVAMVAKQFSRN